MIQDVLTILVLVYILVLFAGLARTGGAILKAINKRYLKRGGSKDEESFDL